MLSYFKIDSTTIQPVMLELRSPFTFGFNVWPGLVILPFRISSSSIATAVG